MNDPLDYSNVGDDLVMDEEERSRRLSNEQIEKIDQRAAAAQEQARTVQTESKPAATAEQPQPQETQPQPTGEEKSEPQLFQGLSYFGQPLGETNQQVKERLSAPGQGLLDFGAQAVNKLASVLMRGLEVPQIPTATKYEDEVAQATRVISSVVLPTVLAQGAGTALATQAQTATVARLGAGSKINQLGNTAFMKFVGSRGVESASAVAVGAVSTEYETGDNLSGICLLYTSDAADE